MTNCRAVFRSAICRVFRDVVLHLYVGSPCLHDGRFIFRTDHASHQRHHLETHRPPVLPTMAPLTADKPWHSYVTLDLLAHVLSRSIFHPYIAWLIPLCLRALATPYHNPEFIFACVWATLVTLWTILGVFNQRLAYGVPRQVDWDEEVVVITGGARGLGKVLAEMFGMRGASVGVLDVVEMERESEGLAGVKHYECDVSDAEAVDKAKQQIEKDVGSKTIHILLNLHNQER